MVPSRPAGPSPSEQKNAAPVGGYLPQGGAVGRTVRQAAVEFANRRDRQTGFLFDDAEFLGGQPIPRVSLAGLQSINPPGGFMQPGDQRIQDSGRQPELLDAIAELLAQGLRPG